MKYTVENGVQVVACTPAEFSIHIVSKAKKSCGYSTYGSGGFMWHYTDSSTKQYVTYPLAHLKADVDTINTATRNELTNIGTFVGTKYTHDNGVKPNSKDFAGNKLSTFYVKGNTCGIDDFLTLPDCDYAVSGVPIIRNGKDVSWYNYCSKQGWGADTVRATSHNFLGIRAGENPICLMAWTSTTDNMVYGMQAYKVFSKMGFTDVIKLDGGGSQHLCVEGNTKKTTSENRVINNIIVITPQNAKTEKTASTTTDVPFHYKTRDAILYIAESQIGVTEAPANSNTVKYNTWYYGKSVSGSAYPWCMAFVQWVFNQAGFNLYKTASCSALKEQYQKAGKWVTSGYKIGDIVMFDFSGKKTKTEHVGIVKAINKDGSLVTIEGNTGTGDDVNGGAVMQRQRALKYVSGACRPDYNM